MKNEKTITEKDIPSKKRRGPFSKVKIRPFIRVWVLGK